MNIRYQTLVALSPADLYEQARRFVTRPAKALQSAKEKVADCAKTAAKVVAAVKRRYADAKDAGYVDQGTTFRKFWEQNCGGPLPGRVEAVAGLFNSLVLTLGSDGQPLLAEDVFDASAIDWLERASAIIRAAQKEAGDWKSHPDVVDAIMALSTPGDAGKRLREIRRRQTTGSEKEPARFTWSDALTLIKGTVAACDESTPYAKAVFQGLLSIQDAWRIQADLLDRWAAEYAAATAEAAAEEAETETAELVEA